MSKVLVVDDDKEIVKAIEIYLKKENYEIFTAYDGVDALKVLSNEKIDLVILDIMMPNLDGLSTVSEIRKNLNIPVIMLSAKSEDYDKIEGLNVGADDYITKPFNPMELIARVNSQLRRYNNFYKKNNTDNMFRTGDLVINDLTKKVSVLDKNVKLTPTEYNILLFLLKNKGKVYSMEDIYNEVCASESYDVSNIIAVHIRHIREKIEINPKEPRYLKIIWGVGYKVEDIKENNYEN